MHISREHYLLRLGTSGVFSSEKEERDEEEDGGKEEGTEGDAYFGTG